MCRLKLDAKMIKPEKVIYSPYFVDGQPGKNQYIDFPYLPLNQDSSRVIERFNNQYEFAYHTYFPTPGSIFYGIPWWKALFEKEGWLQVSANVPKIILAMHANQVSIKYMITIPESYFLARYENWQTLDIDKKQNLINNKINEINSVLTGAANSGKTISQVVKEDPISHNVYGNITIEAIDDKFKRDSWLPDSNVSDAQIVQGFGEHPSQIGLAPQGGKMGAGSGSDQRESYNTSITLNTPDQQVVLEPLNFISRFNGWGVEFYVDHTYHTTTNHQESGMIPAEGSKELLNQ